MKARLSRALAVALLLGGLSVTVYATPISILPTDDRTAQDLNNDLIADSLGPSNDLFMRVFGFSSFFRGVMEFDISSISSSSVVNSVYVRLSDRGTTVAGAMEVYGFAGDGAVSVADANTLTTLIGSFAVVSGDGDYNVALNTGFFQGLVNSNTQWAGLVLRNTVESGFGPGADLCTTEGQNGTSNFPSSLLCQGSTAPQLTLDASAQPVPEPGTLLLLGAGLVAVGRRLRSHRA